MINDDESVSKCLARMKGCWDPEFEPSVEEIVDYPMISLSSLSLASSLSGQGDFPMQLSTWQVKVNRLKPCAQYCTRIRSMRSLSMCPISNLWRRIHEGLWT